MPFAFITVIVLRIAQTQTITFDLGSSISIRARSNSDLPQSVEEEVYSSGSPVDLLLIWFGECRPTVASQVSTNPWATVQFQSKRSHSWPHAYRLNPLLLLEKRKKGQALNNCRYFLYYKQGRWESPNTVFILDFVFVGQGPYRRSTLI